jgi:sulfate permease, SulP family
MTLVAATVVAANTPPGGTINVAVVMTAFLLAGALQVLLGVLRLGGFVRYVPYPVISGFMSGIGVIIIIQQLYPIVGAEAPSSNAVAILGSLSMLPGRILWPVALLGLTTFAIIQILPRFTRKVPASLVALIVVTAVSVVVGVDAPRMGAIPAGLPALVVPDLPFDQIPLVASVAAQLALLGAIDTLLSALLADSLTKSRHDSNRELIGQGIGNMGAALVGGLPGAGANIRTIVNIEAGGKTRLSGVIHGLFLLAVLLGLSGLVSSIPNAVLAGILVAAGLGCIDFRGLSHITKVPRSDAAVLVIVLALTVFAGLIIAVAAGLVIASFVFMKKVADICERQTAISLLADEPWADEIDIPTDLRNRLLVKHVEGPLFFGSPVASSTSPRVRLAEGCSSFAWTACR